jgi:hypothetical protein
MLTHLYHYINGLFLDSIPPENLSLVNQDDASAASNSALYGGGEGVAQYQPLPTGPGPAL